MSADERLPPLPFLFSLLRWVKRRVGREKFVEIMQVGLKAALPIIRANLDRMLGRVTPGAAPRQIEETLARMTVIKAQTWSCVVLDRREVEAECRKVKLELLKPLRRLQERGRGVILASAHFGNTNLAMEALALAGVKLSVLLLKGRIFEQAGAAIGLNILELGESAAACVRALNNNEVLMTFCDLDFYPGDRAADFFGAPVHPPHGTARLALHTGAAVLPFYTLHDGKGVRVAADEPILPEGRTQEEIESALLRSMERWLRRHPDHWMLERDPWDFKTVDRDNRRQLRLTASAREP